MKLIRLLAASGLFIAAFAGTSQAQVPTDAFDVQPLMAGEKAPPFTATSASGETFRFDPDNMEKPALFIFYRGGWCPYCNLYWSELRKIEDELMAENVELAFLSPDRPERLAEAMEGEDPPDYHLLSDSSMEIARDFGIAFKVDEATVARYREYGIDLEEASGYDHHNLPAPGLFLVGTDGIIKYQYVNPDYKIRLHPDVVIAAVKTMPDRVLQRPEQDG